MIEASEKMRTNLENRSFRNFVEQNQNITKELHHLWKRTFQSYE